MNERDRKIARIQLLWAKRRLQIIDSFFQFTIDAFETINPGEKFEANWHIKLLCDRLQEEILRIEQGQEKKKDLIINVPPRSLKSIITTICLPAWAWIRNPHLKVIGASYSSSLSIEHNVICRRLIESSWYQRQFKESFELTSDQNTKSNFENNKGGVRKATSTGGTVTGTGADIIIIDDPLNPAQATSEAERQEANDFFDKTLSTRLNNPKTGVFIVIMQRLHEKDLTGHLLSKEPDKWEHICLPATISEHIKPTNVASNYIDGLLFPVRLNRAFLDTQMTRLGAFGYAGQYSQTPAPDEGGIFKKKWFRTITWQEFLKLVEENKKPAVWNFFLDTAYDTKKKDDPSAIIATCIINNLMFIRNVVARQLEFPDLIRFIPEFVKSNGYTSASRIYVEPKASGKSVVQQLRRQTLLNIIEAPSPDKDKVTRANASAPTVEAGRVILIDGGYMEKYLHEMCLFPNAEHDDQVDCTVMAIDKLIKKEFGSLKATM